MSNPNNFGAGSGNPPIVPGPLSSGEDEYRRGDQYGQQGQYGQQPSYSPGTQDPQEPRDGSAGQDGQWGQQGQYVQPVIGDPNAADYGQAAAPSVDASETVVQQRNPYQGDQRHGGENPHRADQGWGSVSHDRQEQRFEDQRFASGDAGRGGASAADRSMLESNPRVPGDNRNLGEIMGDLTNDFSTLMRQEVALAKAEINQSVKSAGKGAGLLGGAGVAGHMVLLFGSLALWWLIAHLLDGDAPKYGWSFLIVAVLWGIAAAVMAAKGKAELNEVQGVPQTQQTLKQIPDAVKGNEEKNR